MTIDLAAAEDFGSRKLEDPTTVDICAPNDL